MHRLIIPLLLIITLPIGLLSWFGLRMADNEQQLIEYQLQTLIDAQLQSVDDALQAYFLLRQAVLREDATNLQQTTRRLRRHLRNTPWLRQIFLMNGQGQRLHPPRRGPLTKDEQHFLNRSADLWASKAILEHANIAPQNRSQNQARENSKLPDFSILLDSTRYDDTEAQSLAAPAPELPNGWYVWHWGSEMSLIFWSKTANGNLIGFELDPARLRADLIGHLPATGTDDRVGNARLQLRDARGSTLYQWGRFQPDENATPLAKRHLNPPLGHWRLDYYGPTPESVAQTNQLSLFAGLIAVTLALIGLGFYVYREQRRAAQLAEQRVNFVNQVSHELKTPLTNIRMYAELLEHQIDEHQTKPRKHLGVIVNESQRLSRLIANVLSFGRAQREKITLHKSPAQPDQIIRECLDAFRPAFAAKNIHIDEQLSANQTVMLDSEALEQIFNNLLSNVEKYGRDAIQIHSQQRGDTFTLSVQDHGPGITGRDRKRIFNAFYRASNKLTDGVSGAGLGLAIARQLARLHGGDLALQPSERGAHFCLTLNTGTDT